MKTKLCRYYKGDIARLRTAMRMPNSSTADIIASAADVLEGKLAYAGVNSVNTLACAGVNSVNTLDELSSSEADLACAGVNSVNTSDETGVNSVNTSDETGVNTSDGTPLRLRELMDEAKEDMQINNMWGKRSEVHDVILDLEEAAGDFLSDEYIEIHDKLIDIMDSLSEG